MKVHELILYKPHDIQRAMHNSKARFRVGAWGRQAGKSTWGANEIVDKAWTGLPGVYWFLEPSFDQARVQYRRLLEEFPPLCGIHRKKPNDSELRVFLKNNADISYKSGAVLHRLRNETLRGVVIDEVRDQPRALWHQVIRPMLATTNGWAAFLSTPRGFDDFYDLAQLAIMDTAGDWEYFHSPSTCNPLFSQEEFEKLKKEMSEPEFAQEILAEFRDLQRGSAYTSYSFQNLMETSPHVVAPIGETRALPLINPYLPIHLYCDWNVTFMGWVMSQFRHSIGHYAHDEIFLDRSHTEEATEMFITKFRGYEAEIGIIRATPQVILVADATGKAQKTSASGKTDFTIMETALRKANITFSNLTPESNPLVKDRVNTVNSRLGAADGTRQAFLHPKKAPRLKKDLERVTWKLNAQGAILDQKTDPALTHVSDAWGYGIYVTNPIKGVKDVGGIRVVRR